MPVAFKNGPAESGPFILQWRNVVAARHRPIRRLLIPVQQDREVIQLEVGGNQSRFPHRAFITLAIAEQAVDPVRPRVHLPAEGHATGDREALTQRSGGAIHAGGFVPIGVALQAAVQPAEPGEFAVWEEAAHGKRDVQGRGGMAFAEDKSVSIRGVRLQRVNPHPFHIEGRQHLDGAHASAIVQPDREVLAQL